MTGALLALLALSACGRPAPTGGPGREDGAEPGTPPVARHLFLGSQITCVTGEVTRCVGEADFQLPGDPRVLDDARVVDFGLRHGCLLRDDGQPMCWGCTSEGELGVGPEGVSELRRGRPCSTHPMPTPGAPRLLTLASGWLHTCGITRDHRVVCWGDDSLDQLGRSASAKKLGPGPGPVEGLPPATEAAAEALAAGSEHTCALLADGRVACWGDGSEGQLGDGTARDSARPVLVQGLSGPATALAAGAYHTCALLADGSVACWGENRFGQVGDGTRTQRPTAVAVTGLPGPARSLVAGASFNCALLADGGVSCWGSNEMGELGVGTRAVPPLSGRTPPPPPPQGRVETLPGRATALVAAGNHACALLEEGSVWCWGANEYGQLGDGTLEERDRPVEWQGRGAPLPHPEPAGADAAAGPLEGLDVSYHSGRVDWRAAAAQGSRFALTLATAGDDFRDPFFPCHWERMRQAGLLRGAYHFFVADDDPRQQARAFLSHVVYEPGDLVPVVDIEKVGPHPPRDLPQRLQAFVDEIEARLGVKPIIYTGPAFWNANFRGGFGDYPLWLAQYGVDRPAVPAGWNRWIFWQWRGNADLPDVAPVVDLDRLGAGVDLSRLLIPERPPERVAPGSGAPNPPTRR